MKLEEIQARFGSEVDHPELLPLAAKVYDLASEDAKEDNYTFDIVTIIMLVNLLYRIGMIIWNWYHRDKELAIRKSCKLSIFQRFILWTVVARKVPRKERAYLYDGVGGMVYKFTDDERKLWFKSY